ncbi:MAG: hypothetical protein PHY44_00535 [Lachnospiraceae bacterium]|nr:hypothetical protein [Lachnospiraceae bacterium]
MAKHMSGEEEFKTEVDTGLKKEFETKANTEGEEVVEVEAKGQDEDEPKFTKEQLLNSKKYGNRKDMLTALLTDGESYTHSEVSRITEEFLKGEIK